MSKRTVLPSSSFMPISLLLADTGQLPPVSLAAGFVSALAGLVSALAGLVSTLDDERAAQAISTRTPLKFVVFISASAVPPGVVATPVLASALVSGLASAFASGLVFSWAGGVGGGVCPTAIPNAIDKLTIHN